jgi:hypothetical protein
MRLLCAPAHVKQDNRNSFSIDSTCMLGRGFHLLHYNGRPVHALLHVIVSTSNYYERRTFLARNNKSMSCFSRNGCCLFCRVSSLFRGWNLAATETNGSWCRSCQGVLATSRMSAYSFEEERAISMRSLSEDGWLNYLDKFLQTDDDLVAFLKIPVLTEKVRDCIVSKIYNLPREDSGSYWRWNSIRKDLASNEKQTLQIDLNISGDGNLLFAPKTDVELGLRQ